MTFTDKSQFKQGMDVEWLLDELFRSKGWVITKTTPHEERVLCLGDRWFERGKVKYSVEYKSGIQTLYTGNVFFETVSVDAKDKPGWLYTSQARFLLYATLLNEKILVFSPDMLRQKVSYLKAVGKEVKTSKGQNDGYNTHGLIVPLGKAEQLTARIIPFPIDQLAEYALKRILVFAGQGSMKEIKRLAAVTVKQLADARAVRPGNRQKAA